MQPHLLCHVSCLGSLPCFSHACPTPTLRNLSSPETATGQSEKQFQVFSNNNKLYLFTSQTLSQAPSHFSFTVVDVAFYPLVPDEDTDSGMLRT